VIATESIPVRRQPTLVRALLASAIDVMQPQARAAGILLKSVVEPDVPATMSLDADKVAWAIVTLIGSALRHVPSGSRFQIGGTIDVQTSVNPRTSAVIIEIKDNGPGISKEKLPLLLHRDPERPLVGLSLMLVQDVMAAHGGRIEIDSSTEPFESGTMVRLTLPVS
jgi:signal transduction histidine kinase